MERHRIYMEHVTASVTVRDYIIGLEKTRTADHVDAKTRTADHVDAKTRTTDHVDAKTRTADHVDAKTRTADHVDAKTRTADHVDAKTRTADHVDAKTRTADHVDAKTRTADHMDAKTRTADHMDAKTRTADHMDAKTRTADHMDAKTRTADHVDVKTRTADHVDEETRTADHVDALRPLARQIGTTVGLMHSHDVIHGDLTTSNMLLRTLSKGTPDAGGDSVAGFQLVLIDFGLGYKEGLAEDKGVDLYVLERALLSTHPNTEGLFSVILEHYRTSYVKGAAGVINKLEEIRMRGRKRTMVG